MRLWISMGVVVVSLGVCAATNIVQNGSFERLEAKGLAVGWTGNRCWRCSQEGVGGSVCAVYENDDPTFRSPNYGVCQQTVAAQPRWRYAFGATVNTANLKGTGRVGVEWYGADGKIIGGDYSEELPEGHGWTSLRGLSRVIPTNAVKVVLLAHPSHGNSGRLLVDDMWMREVAPEPLGFIGSSCYRNAAADGEVTFKAVLNLLPGDEATVCGTFTVADPERPAAVQCRAAEIVQDVACATFPIESLALGENTVEFRLTGLPGRAGATNTLAFTRLTPEQERKLKVRFDATGRTVLDGKPFFPLGMYWDAVNERDLDRYAKSAFNCLIAYTAPTRRQMDQCAERGLKVVYHVVGRDLSDGSVIRRFRGHPALLAWYLNDEGGASAELVRARQFAAAYDPDHPCWSVIWQHGEVRDHLPTCDVIGTDPYPLYDRPLRLVTDWTQDAKTGTMDLKPLWQVTQACDKWAYPWNRKKPECCRPPTCADMRNLAWQCLAGGAKGLFFYSYFDLVKLDKRTPFEKRWADVTKVAAEVKAHECHLLSSEPSPQVSVDSRDVVARAWRRGKHRLLAVINVTETPVSVRVTVDGTPRAFDLATAEVKLLKEEV